MFTVVDGTATKRRDSCRIHCHLPTADTIRTQSAPCGWNWHYVASVNKNNAFNIALYHAEKDAKWDNTMPKKNHFDPSADVGLRDFKRYDMEPYPEIEIPFRLKGSTDGNYTNLTAKYELSAYPLENTIGFLRMAEFDAGKVGFYRDHFPDAKTVQDGCLDKTFYNNQKQLINKQKKNRFDMLDSSINMQDAVNLRRKVMVDSTETLMEFTVARVKPGTFPEGRLQILTCHTPENFWLPGDMDHANRADTLTDLLICVEDVAEARRCAPHPTRSR